MAISLLLADDSPTIAKILTMALASEDYSIRTVETADQAIQELQNNPPYFFLVDASLPSQDGLALSRFVKSNPVLQNNIRIVLLANAFDPVDEASREAAGVDAVIVKPFDPAELRSVLRALASQSPKLVSASIDVSDSPPPFSNFAATPGTSLQDEIQLSPSAQMLESFFHAEVDSHNANAAIALTNDSESNDSVDFSQVDTDWNTLSQWSSTQQTPSADMFDTGESSFIFSTDYSQKITRAFAGTQEEEQANRKKNLAAENSAQPQLHAVLPSHDSTSHSAFTGASPLSREDMENIIREEVRSACKDVVEKITWEVIPELAENLIRKELEKVLKSMDA